MVIESASVQMSGFDSSDDEGQEFDTVPFRVDWLNLEKYDLNEPLGLSGLPGCRFKDTWRNLSTDIGSLKSNGIEEVFVLCTRGELTKYRVPRLMQELTASGINVHHFPFPDGLTPSPKNLADMINKLTDGLRADKKCLIHCYGGLGRTCLVAACLLLSLDAGLEPEPVITKLRNIRGPGAIQSVKQYNFVNEYRDLMASLVKENEENTRSVSR